MYLLCLTLFLFLALAGFFIRSMFARLELLQEEIDNAERETKIVLSFMNDIVSDLAAGADKNLLYAKILKAVILSCGASSAAIYEKTKDSRLRSVLQQGTFPPQREINKNGLAATRVDMFSKIFEGEELELHEGVIGEAATGKTPVFVRNAAGDPRILKHRDSSLKVSSMMALPLVFGEEFFGVLAVANPTDNNVFSDTDFSVAKGMAIQAAFAIFNLNNINELIEKNKLDYDLKLASSVQQYLLPKELPRCDTYEFAVKYIPQQQLGGDFYDAFWIDEKKLALLVADVSGKGISAAIIMGLAQSKLRYIAKEQTSPAEVLKELNREILSSMRMDMFITMTYAVLDTQANTISLARAGHEKPLHYSSANRACSFLKSGGMAVGMVTRQVFDLAISEVDAKFDAGDIFVLYTDGVTEARDQNNEEFSTQGLADLVKNSAQLGANELAEKITNEVFSFSRANSVADDDFTLLTIKRTK